MDQWFLAATWLALALVAIHLVGAVAQLAIGALVGTEALGFTGHSKIYDHLRGRASQNLTRMSPCSVLVVK